MHILSKSIFEQRFAKVKNRFAPLAGLLTSLTLSLMASVSVTAAPVLTVVELYTSQGCSSCPPADKLISQLADEPNVLALSFHVDYWDYIGWKDPFALKKSTYRQRAYAERLVLPYVYTPQIIVGGSMDVVGSHTNEVRAHVQNMVNRTRSAPQINLTVVDRSTVALSPMSLTAPLEIWQIDYTPHSQTQVLLGENKGKRLTHRNSVRAFERLGTWRGEGTQVRLKNLSSETSAILLQEANSGPIRAAFVVK